MFTLVKHIIYVMDINSYFCVTEMMQIYICDLFLKEEMVLKNHRAAVFCSMKMDWDVNHCWTDMGLFTGYCSMRSTETLLKSPPSLVLPRDVLNAGDRNSALRTSLPR